MSTTTRNWLGQTACVAAAALLLLASQAPAKSAAQDVCADDAGDVCEDDGGVGVIPRPRSDAGALSDGGLGLDGGFADGGAAPGVACSCEADTNPDQSGRIHVCTESFERDVCADFGCERGTRRTRGCPDDDVALCCTMRARGLSSYLYEDCTHANCESGFREQCREFGGTVSEGACDVADDNAGEGSSEGGESSGRCTVVSAPGARRELGLAALLLGAAPLLTARRRRARR